MRKLSIVSLFLIALGVIGCTSLNDLTLDDFRDLIGDNNSTNFYSDDIVPSISIAYPTNNMTVQSTFELLGFAAGEKGIENVFVFVMKTNATVPTVIPAVIEGDGTNQLVTFRAAVSVLNNGYFYVWAQLHDKEGEVVNTPQRIVYVSSSVVDNEAPLITIQSPAANYVGISGSLQVSGTAYDVSGVSMIYVKIGSTTNTIPYEGGSWSTVFNLGDGQFTIEAWGKDNKNNSGGNVFRTVTLTNAPGLEPVITVYRGTSAINNGGAGYNFGSLLQNTSGPWISFTVSNAGNNDLTVSAPQDNSSDFEISNANANPLLPGQKKVFYMSFYPKSSGTKNATVTIINNDTDRNPFTFTVTGIGTNAGGVSAPDIKVYYGSAAVLNGHYTNDFGTFLTNNGTGSKVFKISNAGNTNLVLSSVYENSVYYSCTFPSGYSLPAGASTNVNVQFSPSAAGIHWATLTINNNDENPFEFLMKATATNGIDAVPPTFTVSPYSANIASSSFDLKAAISENGKIYYIVITNGATAPSSLQVKNGINYGAVTVLKSGNVSVSASSLATMNITGLSSGADYDVYAVGEDGAFNVIASPVKVDVMTVGGQKYTMIIDGTKDANWANAFSVNGTNTLAPVDIMKLYAANDGTNLYLAVDSSDPLASWNRNLLVFFQIDDTLSAGTPSLSGEAHFGSGDTWDANWKPTGAIFFKIGGSETWKGTFAHKVNTSGTGWDNIIVGATGNHGISADNLFVEGKFNLTSLSLSAGKKIKFYVVITHQWNEYSDSSLPMTYTPDSDVNNVSSHTPVIWTQNYTIK
ncbi:MAG: hypothetical protein A2Y33_14435 [Spirochaetes bacterium GWF1_51_8]|nr:MAG: hypothetical protein A2Y33_14435 [Spirochaetes bacterium GWF1_51_8]